MECEDTNDTINRTESGLKRMGHKIVFDTITKILHRSNLLVDLKNYKSTQSSRN